MHILKLASILKLIPLVSCLDLAQIEAAIAYCCSDQVVTTSLITISCMQKSFFRHLAS